MSDDVQPRVSRRFRFRHAIQREIGRLAAPFWVPFAVFMMRFILGYRIRDLRRVREQFRRIQKSSDTPLLICANHLTLIDSGIIAWALVPWWRYAVHFDDLPWNTPERRNFAATRLSRALIYVAKCIPIIRGGSRSEVSEVLARVAYLLRRGEVALLFPEAGRSRTGRVTTESLAWGVGRIVGSVAHCRVACVYARGDLQETWGSIPSVGDRFTIDIECIEPKSDFRGARRSRDIASQIAAKLARMERKYFDGRE